MKILFAIDGSRCSKKAVDSIVNMKCPIGTEIKIITSVDFFLPKSAGVDIRDTEMKAAGNLVEEAAKKLKSAHPNVEISGEILEGHVVENILNYSESWPADLIMLGSHGRSGISELLLGSVSRAILSNAQCAVRIVRPDRTPVDTSKATNVLVGLEESQHAKHLIDHIVRLPWSPDTRFNLVNVVPEVTEEILFDPRVDVIKAVATKYDSIIEERRDWLNEISKKINSTFEQDVASSDVLIGDARKVLLDRAKNWPADIIILGSHSRHGIEKFFLGSVSEAVATHAPCSVEVTRVPSATRAKVKA